MGSKLPGWHFHWPILWFTEFFSAPDLCIITMIHKFCVGSSVDKCRGSTVGKAAAPSWVTRTSQGMNLRKATIHRCTTGIKTSYTCSYHGVVWVVPVGLHFNLMSVHHWSTGTRVRSQRQPYAWWTCDVPNHSLGRGRTCPTQSWSTATAVPQNRKSLGRKNGHQLTNHGNQLG